MPETETNMREAQPHIIMEHGLRDRDVHSPTHPHSEITRDVYRGTRDNIETNFVCAGRGNDLVKMSATLSEVETH